LPFENNIKIENYLTIYALNEYVGAYDLEATGFVPYQEHSLTNKFRVVIYNETHPPGNLEDYNVTYNGEEEGTNNTNSTIEVTISYTWFPGYVFNTDAPSFD